MKGLAGDVPETEYVRVGRHNIAYQVIGSGPLDVVFCRNVFNHLEAQWEQPRMASFLRRLASFSRLIMHDARGSGLSDPFTSAAPELDEWSDDLLGILEATGAKRPALISASSASLRALLFAATHPDHSAALVVCDGMASMLSADDYPFGRDEHWVEWWAKTAGDSWGTADGVRSMYQDIPADLVDWVAHYQRVSVSRGQAVTLMRYAPKLDVRTVLEVIGIPTMVVVHTGSGQTTGIGAARFIADRILDAKYVELPGQPIIGWIYPDPDAVVDQIQQFLTGVSGAREPNRVLATLLFTDVVGSTTKASQVGDRRWSEVLDALDRLVARQVERFGGKVISSTGDGHLATFDAPGRGIRCARAISEATKRLDLKLRVGLHTGEIELRGEQISGIAVHIGRRVCDFAAPDELLVSSSIPPLVTGSEFHFVDRGEYELKGVPGRWQLFSVQS